MMTKLILFTELLEIGTDLLETGMPSSNIYETRTRLDSIFAKFEEDSDFPICDLTEVLDNITIKVLSIPKELKDYFRIIESFQTDNELYPQLHTVEETQLLTEFFTILENLLATSMTPCDAHQTHLQLDDLFKAFQEQAEAFEEMAGIDDDEFPTALNHFFPDLAEVWVGLTLFPL
jgi:hypothetical protein